MEFALDCIWWVLTKIRDTFRVPNGRLKSLLNPELMGYLLRLGWDEKK